jgi:hypothetical protein
VTALPSLVEVNCVKIGGIFSRKSSGGENASLLPGRRAGVLEDERRAVMNGLGISELCGLFCCPPFPSRIAAKLAFLPPEPTYKMIADVSGAKFTIELNEKAEWQYPDREKENLEVFYTRTNRGNRIACMYVRCSANNRFTILFSHGNAVDLGQMSSFYVGLGSRINCNIFSYDYSGKGSLNSDKQGYTC